MKKLLAVLMLLISWPSWSADKISTGIFSNKAVSGYDTVAYFTEGNRLKETVNGNSNIKVLIGTFLLRRI